MFFLKRKRLIPKAPLVPFFIAATLGILCDSLFSPGPLFWTVVLGSAFVFLLISLFLFALERIDERSNSLEFLNRALVGSERFHHRAFLWIGKFFIYCNNKLAYGFFFAYFVFFVAYGMRHEYYLNFFPENEIGLYLDREGAIASCRLKIKNTPMVYRSDTQDRPLFGVGKTTRFVAEIIRATNKGRWEDYSGLVTVTVDDDASYLRIGDCIEATGRLSLFSHAKNPGDLDRLLYYRAQRILTSFSIKDVKSIELLSESKSFRDCFFRFFEDLRFRAGELLSDFLSERNAAVARGMTLGFRNDVDDETNDSFRKTGTIHLLAISGLHVTLVVGFFVFFLRRIGTSPRFVSFLTIGLVLFYLFLTDVRTPVIRASVLIIVLSLGALLGRRGNSLNSLLFAALFILAINPCELFQLGAQLSFLATGVFLWDDRLTISERAEEARKFSKESRFSVSTSEKRKGFLKQLFKRNNVALESDDSDELELHDLESDIRIFQRVDGRLWKRFFKALKSFLKNVFSVAKTGLCIWMIGSPLLLRTTHLFTPMALIANPLIWLPATSSLLLAFSLLFFGLGAEFFPFGLSWFLPIIGVATNFCFDCFLGVLDFASSPSWGAFYIPAPQKWSLWLFYLPLIFWTLFPHRRPSKVAILLLGIFWLNTTLYGYVWDRYDKRQKNELCVQIFSVGHGCATCGIFSDGRTFLYDCGNLNNSQYVAQTVAKNLWRAGKTHIDLAIISHADYDHYSGLEKLADFVSIRRVAVSPVMFDKSNLRLDSLKQRLSSKGIPIEIISKRESLDYLGFPEFCIFHPSPNDLKEDFDKADESNPFSVVVGIEHEGRKILLPGDLDTSNASFLNARLKFDLMLAPHHGGKSSNYKDLLAWASPDSIVISGGERLRNHETEEKLRQEGFNVFHTVDDGCITIIIDRANNPKARSGRFSINTFLSNISILDESR